jgi:hypothetical protein
MSVIAGPRFESTIGVRSFDAVRILVSGPFHLVWH